MNAKLILGTPLLYKITQDTVGEPVVFQNNNTHTLAVQAEDFGGGTVTIEWSLDAVTWTTLVDSAGQSAVFTANALKVGLTFKSIYLRASLADSSGAKNLNVVVG